MKRIATGFTAAAVWLAAAAHAPAMDMDELEVDHALTSEVETPHTNWAQPYAKGRTRVLFFTNGRGTAPRECVELMQRFDIDAEAVFWARIVDSSNEHWHGGSLGEQRMLKLLEQPWDCYVFFDMLPTKLSAEQQVKLLTPVTEGAGLVLLGKTDPRLFKDSNTLSVPPFLTRGGEPEQLAAIGRGRGVVMPSQPTIPYAEGWEMQYDYWAERVGRAILWAAAKEPAAHVKITPEKNTVDYGDTMTMNVATMGTYTDDNLTLTTRMRRPAGPLVQFPQRDIRPGRGITLRIPALPAGDYVAEAWITSKAGVEAWNSVPITVKSRRLLSEPDLEKNWGEIGDSITGTVTVDGFPYPDETVRVRLLDRRRRELARQDLQPADGQKTVRFAIPTAAWMPMLITVEAQLMNADEEVTRTSVYYNMVKRNQHQFNFLVWDLPRGTLAPYAEEVLAQTGVTLQLNQSSDPPDIVAAYDIAWVPYTTRILANLDADGTMKPFCWNDTEAVHKHVTEKAEAYAGARQHGVFVWSLGDEVHTQGACLSPYCAEAYRDFLRKQYGSLDALNASWDTSFANWQQVGLSDPEDNDEATALRAGNYPRWFDRQAFKSWNFVQFCTKYRKAYEAVDPKALVGFEGAGRFDRGDNIDLIVQNNTFWSPYPGTVDEVIRSIAPRDFPRANWMGYTKDADSLLLKYWRMVTRGMDSVWWWRWDCIGRFHGWLAPDLRPFPAVKEILRDTQIVRDGLGDLLLQSYMQDDAIAMLYSYPSSIIHKQENGASFGGYESAHTAAHTLVRELGFQFRYTTDRIIREGGFDPKQYKLLILPRAEALSDAEATAIRTFVEQGGFVIADVRTGLFDEHCKPRSAGALDTLFGITRNGRPQALVAKDTPYGTLKLDPGVTLADGTAAFTVDGCPFFVTKATGKGRTLFLNADFSSFPNLALHDTPEKHALNMALQFAEADLFPEYTLLSKEDSRERNVEVTRWKNGDTEIVSLFRRGGNRSETTIVLPQPAFVYDLRNRRSLGREARVNIDIIPNRATFLVVSPEAVREPEIVLDGNTVQRGSLATARIQVPNAHGKHAVRIRVALDGMPLEWYDQTCVVDAEPVTIDLPVAFNDPEGTYEITVTDLVTNKTVTAVLVVE